jgi:hypothetical protein
MAQLVDAAGDGTFVAYDDTSLRRYGKSMLGRGTAHPRPPE